MNKAELINASVAAAAVAAHECGHAVQHAPLPGQAAGC